MWRKLVVEVGTRVVVLGKLVVEKPLGMERVQIQTERVEVKTMLGTLEMGQGL